MKSVIENVTPDVREASRQRQQTKLASELSKDFVDIINVLCSNLAQAGLQTSGSNLTQLIYQQFEVLRRATKDDQAIRGDSQAGLQSTIALLVDIARLEIRFIQTALDRCRPMSDSSLRARSVRDVDLRIIESLVSMGRSIAPATKPLADLIRSAARSPR